MNPSDAVLDKPLCPKLMELRWHWYYLNGVAYRLRLWRQPKADKWSAWARQAAKNIKSHLQGCEACKEVFGDGIELLVAGN